MELSDVRHIAPLKWQRVKCSLVVVVACIFSSWAQSQKRSNEWVAQKPKLEVKVIRVGALKISNSPLLAIQFVGDKAVAALSEDGKVCVWDFERRKLTCKHKCGGKLTIAGAFSSDGKVVAHVQINQVVKVCHLVSGKLVANISGHGGEIRQLAFSHDGRMIAVACEGCCNMEGDMRLWSLSNSKFIRRFKGDAFSVALSRDGRLVAVGGRESLTVWDAGSAGELRRFNVGGRVRWVSFSNRGKLLACATVDGVRAFVVGSWQVKPLLKISWAKVLSFSHDDSLLAVSAHDEVFLIDVNAWKIIMRLKGHSCPIMSVAFAPASMMLATGGSCGRAILWEVKR